MFNAIWFILFLQLGTYNRLCRATTSVVELAAPTENVIYVETLVKYVVIQLHGVKCELKCLK